MFITKKTKNSLQNQMLEWKKAGYTTAFVPTMGALHDGHISLIERAAQKADKVVISIFVNPTQFAPDEDFDSYPRDLEEDCLKLKQTKANCLYLPQRNEIYPSGPKITVPSGPAGNGLESDFRPHFFDGVCTIVSALLDHVEPDIAVFGEKDLQQLMVIKEMAALQRRMIDIIGAPIVRDEHGLALSSRNAYLSADELEIARQLNKIIRKTDNPDALLNAGFTKIDYIEERWNRRLAAAWIGKTRLIDNISCRK